MFEATQQSLSLNSEHWTVFDYYKLYTLSMRLAYGIPDDNWSISSALTVNAITLISLSSRGALIVIIANHTRMRTLHDRIF